jgi:DNA-binding transcriptional MerR regulator
MEADDPLTIGAAARLAGITVRTLHHYDEIGLVSPSGRSEGGYRLYGRADVERLQEVLLFRALGLSLHDIGSILDEPAYRREDALRRQKSMLIAKADHLLEMAEAVERVMSAEEKGIRMTAEEMLEIFGDFDPEAYREEAETRWGETDAYAESARRTAGYTPNDWRRLKDEAEAINRELVELKAAGVPPTSDAAMAAAERHREHISKWFYDCTPDIHVGLGRMYVADGRFRKNIDLAGEGLAEYMAATIEASGSRARRT